MLKAVIRLFQRNPILSTLWAIFTCSFFFLVHEEYTSAPQIASLRTMAAKVENQIRELKSVEDAVHLYDKTIKDLSSISFPSSDEIRKDVLAAISKEILDIFEYRNELQNSRIVLASLYFENPALKEFQTDLSKNLDQVETYFSRRIDLLNAMKADFPGMPIVT